MAKFLITTKVNQDLPIICSFVEETNKRLKNHDLTRNPFFGSLASVTEKENYYVLVDMTPIWPVSPFVYIGTITLIMVFVFGWNLTALVVPGFFFLITLLWTETFLYLLLVLGLRKKGFSHVVKKISVDNSILSLFI